MLNLQPIKPNLPKFTFIDITFKEKKLKIHFQIKYLITITINQLTSKGKKFADLTFHLLFCLCRKDIFSL